ncbi:MAG: lipid-A-disaccharide synthase [Desulfobacterales bacterium]
MNQAEHKKCVLIVSGEDSGDLHGSNLVKAMKSKDGSLRFYGVGGKKLKEAGLQILFPSSELSVMGITEVFSKLPAIFKALGIVKRFLRSQKPDLLILIDFADFNLQVAKAAKKIGVPVLYYIPPKAWAWRPGRIKKIRERTDHLAVILPFEADFFQSHGLPTTFVGHPLLDNYPVMSEAVKKKDQNAGERSIGLLPGSRKKEIIRHLPVMLDAAGLIRRRIGEVRFLVSVAPSADRIYMEGVVNTHSEAPYVEFVTGGVNNVFDRVDFLVAASGTVTMEAALAGIPMVIIYIVSAVSYILGKSLAKVKYAGLANLIAGREIIPELLQWEAIPEKISEKVCTILEDAQKMEKTRKELMGIRELLGGPGAAECLADIALKMLAGEKIS